MSRYAEAHLWSKLNGPGDARPTAMQIIKDYGKEGALQGKSILLTGVTSGIGIPTATALAATGATLFCAARSTDKAREALSSIANLTSVRFVQLDLSSLASVRACATEVLAQTGGKLNMLVNNAGILSAVRKLSADGFEIQLATNYLGPFLLFSLLRDALLAAATPGFPSRVINVSSVGHHSTPVLLDDMNLERQPNPLVGYGHSKTAFIHMASEIERRWGARDLHAWSLQPGGVHVEEGSGLVVDAGLDEEMVKKISEPFPAKFFKSAAQGAATTVWAAVSDETLADGARGKYLEDCAVAKPMRETAVEHLFGYADWAYDSESAKSLWDVSEKLVGLKNGA
ncbi:Oxidoreductase [Pleurostoma richardsiae]|uniref:Oxidoreductase n=1 Tax=Pleurostoma richardsiae TaxID=41990 RepID=A0AA38R7D1_9PEZI|nr:Oxidoreductase [Pleurostoma richardsiae]